MSKDQSTHPSAGDARAAPRAPIKLRTRTLVMLLIGVAFIALWVYLGLQLTRPVPTPAHSTISAVHSR
jgi:hypothetical protein